ncbi:hypothetical protein [Bacillus sp. 1P06AnD]|uniref:hypothetical protein n=1 Tax=Bacillus sp. 1P06AnD TaxID=3132208 RepID=UPI0039A2E7B2
MDTKNKYIKQQIDNYFQSLHDEGKELNLSTLQQLIKQWDFEYNEQNDPDPNHINAYGVDVIVQTETTSVIPYKIMVKFRIKDSVFVERIKNILGSYLSDVQLGIRINDQFIDRLFKKNLYEVQFISNPDYQNFIGYGWVFHNIEIKDDLLVSDIENLEFQEKTVAIAVAELIEREAIHFLDKEYKIYQSL